MSRIVGIDLGTTNSLVATVDAGIPLVIADLSGRRLTPSIVSFGKDEESRPQVGFEAQRLSALQPRETVYSIKRLMGRRQADLTNEDRRMPYQVVHRQSDGAVGVEIHGRFLLPEEISAHILTKLKSDAESYFNEPVTRAVITVPAYFNDAQRNATKKAGELAGFTVERIVNEPTAAALSYGLDRLKEKSRIAVYDLGGGTFDLSILELTEGVFQVLSTNGNTRLGGDDLDRRIVEFLVAEIAAAGGPDLASAIKQGAVGYLAAASMLARVREAAEQAKIRLSSEIETDLALPFLTPEFSFSFKFTRNKLEELTRDIIGRTREHCLRSLADAKLEAKDLDQVTLVGGQTRMPLVRKFVSELFGCANFEETRGQVRLGAEYHRRSGPELNTSQNPDEAVALGAAVQAEILSGGFKNMLLLDVTPLSLGLETFGGLMNVIIPRNSTIPIKAGEMFTTAVDHQPSMLIHVLQGERERARDNWSLGKFTLEFEKAPRGVPRVGVQFEVDSNGILHVLARDTKTGQEKVVEIKSAVDVEDESVQRMVEESVAHAFEDLGARRWIEARLKAMELIRATTKALEDCREQVEPDYSNKVREALQKLKEAAGPDNSDAPPGNLQTLQAAIAVLDEVTRPMAELLMDLAMEKMLRKRGLIK